MFPIIFSLSIDGLGANAARGSSYLCMAIVGGAILPLLQGVLADSIGPQLAFVMPAIAYAYVLYFAFWRQQQMSEPELAKTGANC
jgi:FHS family L-fucose permease-like MFS transporter